MFIQPVLIETYDVPSLLLDMDQCSDKGKGEVYCLNGASCLEDVTEKNKKEISKSAYMIILGSINHSEEINRRQ